MSDSSEINIRIRLGCSLSLGKFINGVFYFILYLIRIYSEQLVTSSSSHFILRDVTTYESNGYSLDDDGLVRIWLLNLFYHVEHLDQENGDTKQNYWCQ